MQQRALTLRLIRLAMGAALLLPCLLFGVASWISYRNVENLTTERLTRSLEVELEEAQKTFLVVNHILDDASAVVADLSPAEIRASEGRIHDELRELRSDLPVAQSIWIYDANGDALATTAIEPPPSISFDDRDFVRAHQAGGAGTYYGRVYPPIYGPQPYFTVSRGVFRDGALATIVVVAVPPSSFSDFYATLASGPEQEYALIRDDGALLARYPAAPPGAPDQLGEGPGFRRTIATDPGGGFYTSTSPIDGVTRRFAARRLGDTPLYLSAGIATAAIRQEWVAQMAPHLVFGLPATLLLFLTLLIILRRTQRLYAEIDQRSLAEESLRQAQKMEAIGQLTGGVAHDFNNLLTIILGNLETAKRQLAKDNDKAKLASRIESAIQGANRAATLTKRLLAFSRQQTLNPTAVDVNKLLGGLADFLQRTIGEETSLEVVGSAGLWPIDADQTELEAAIINLAVNARDAMPEGGKLTIEAANSYLDDDYARENLDVRPGQYVQIAVSDTGGGMPKDVVDRAFEPFFTTKPAGQGTGLGLSQVYGFVKQSGGHVKIYSELGLGTTVKMYLPRRLAASPPPRAAPANASRGRPGETVLVAEDDSEVRAYVVETLEELGYNAVGVADAAEALRVLDRNGAIDLLLTDVIMPGVNGRKLAEQATRLHPELKVVFMTGYSRNAIVHQGRLDPDVELIQKPLTSDALATRIRKVLDR